MNEPKVTILKREDILRCPMVIFLPSHYRSDGSCRCDEKTCEWNEGLMGDAICTKPKWRGEIYCKYHVSKYG